MPLYFTHIRDGGTLIQDLEGQTFADLEEAVEDARASAREMLAEKILAGEVANGQTLEICDESGETVAMVPFRDVLRLVP